MSPQRSLSRAGAAGPVLTAFQGLANTFKYSMRCSSSVVLRDQCLMVVYDLQLVPNRVHEYGGSDNFETERPK